MKSNETFRARYTPWILLIGLMGFASAITARGDAQVIGQTQSRLDASNADRQENSFGCLATDALRSVTGADIAVVAAAAFSPGAINPGTITAVQVGNLFVSPEDKVVVVELSGEIIRKMLERSLSVYPSPNDGFLQVSGLKVVFNPRRPSENRIVQVQVTTAGRAESLDDHRTYRVATNTTLGRGGLGYFKIVGPSPKVTRLSISQVEAIVQYLRGSGTVQYGSERRIATT